MTFGPKSVIEEAFAKLGAEHVLTFGSWAARLGGEPGTAPSDIDVLVVGNDIPRADLYAAAERAEVRLGRPVNPVLRAPSNWAQPTSDPLLDEIMRRPRVDVTSPASLITSR